MTPSLLDEATKAEIIRDTGDCKEGMAYVKDEVTGKWREVEPRDYEV